VHPHAEAAVAGSGEGRISSNGGVDVHLYTILRYLWISVTVVKPKLYISYVVNLLFHIYDLDLIFRVIFMGGQYYFLFRQQILQRSNIKTLSYI
jgi:hypothetical protein